MAIELAEKYLPYVDEMFTTESKKSLLTNQDFTFEGAHSVKVYKISTGKMNNYGRNYFTDPESKRWSHYGTVETLDATTERFALSRDRSFTFAIDALDEDETVGALEASTALARQIREVVIPEIDTYVYGKMCTGAGIKPDAIELTVTNIYDEIIKAGKAMDNAEVPETGRILMITPNEDPGRDRQPGWCKCTEDSSQETAGRVRLHACTPMRNGSTYEISRLYHSPQSTGD